MFVRVKIGWMGVELKSKGAFSFWDHNSPALGNVTWNFSTITPQSKAQKREKYIYSDPLVHKFSIFFLSTIWLFIVI